MSQLSSYHESELMNPREILIREYAYLVKRIGHHIHCRLPRNINIDDIFQAGLIGLIEATQRYDSVKGASFGTFASIRIRGAILDEVRRSNWLPRSVAQNARRIKDAIHHIEQANGRGAHDSEIAQYLNLSEEEYFHMLEDVGGLDFLSFDTDNQFIDGAVAHESLSESGSIEKETLKSDIAKIIRKLPEQEQLVLSFYYTEELNFKEIAAIMEVSESRICQIHAKAITHLKAFLQVDEGVA